MDVPPAGFVREALCIHHWETRGHPDPGAWHLDTGNGQSGGLQFSHYTWRSVGGRGEAWMASRREQIYRAWVVYLRDGRSWREWTTAPLCHLR
ncbi:MAG: transglycosylase family protein [Actinomycetes bacterium]